MIRYNRGYKPMNLIYESLLEISINFQQTFVNVFTDITHTDKSD